MPDDVLNTQEDNYHYWKKLPAVYPAHIFKKQKEDLQFAKKQAQRKMIGDLVKTAALTAVTFGAGAALGPGLSAAANAGSKVAQVGAKALTAAQAQYSGRALATATASTAYGAYQANNAAAKSLKGLKKQQDKIREMIDAETVESGTMKLNGKIYTGINSSDMSDMDYHSADSYFLNAPGFTTQLILLEPNESFGNRFFPTTFQSNIPRIDWGTSDIKDMYDAEYQYDYNEALVTVTENNMIGLIDTVGDDFDGYLFIDSQGRRYLFDTAIEWAKAVDIADMPGFIPPELEDSLPDEGAFSTFSWRDHYPGGITNSPADLRDHEDSRMGAAEYLLQDHVLGWGLTRIQDGNKALHGKGNEIQFEYVEMELHPGDDVYTVAETSASKTGGAYYAFDNGVFTTSPSGHKTLSRGFKKFQLLHKITSETHQAEFVYSYDREDGKEAFALSDSELDGKPKLQEIKMWAIQGDSQKLVSKYVFEYDYSLMYGAPDNQNANPIAAGASCGAGLDMCGRLTLKSLQYVSYASGSEAAMPKIEFTYANGDGPKTRDACDEDNLNWVTKCVLQNKDVDEELSDTANPDTCAARRIGGAISFYPQVQTIFTTKMAAVITISQRLGA